MLNLRCDGFLLGNNGAVFRTHEDAVMDKRFKTRELSYKELAALHRTQVTSGLSRRKPTHYNPVNDPQSLGPDP